MRKKEQARLFMRVQYLTNTEVLFNSFNDDYVLVPFRVLAKLLLIFDEL